MLRTTDYFKKLCLAMFFCNAATLLSAQTNLNIYQNDGTIWQIPVSNLDSLTYINGVTNDAITVITQPPTGVTHNTATLGGEITTTDGFTALYRGVCWDTVPMPTIAALFAADANGGDGSFMLDVSTYDGLIPGVTHYARAYAMNGNWTIYGEQQSFTLAPAYAVGNGVTDVDGNPYGSVVIGDQEWTVENLRVKRYNNGDSVQNTPGVTQWANNDGIGKWCSYDNDPQYDIPFGNLYNWYAVSDPRNLCPIEWHVPSDGDWYLLSLYLDPQADTICVNCLSPNMESTVTGTILKEAGFVHWEEQVDYNGGTNSAGFTALPGGERSGATPAFALLGINGTWWTSTEYYTPWGYFRTMYHDYGIVFREYMPKTYGYSVRCVKD